MYICISVINIVGLNYFIKLLFIVNINTLYYMKVKFVIRNKINNVWVVFCAYSYSYIMCVYCIV